MRVSLLVTVAAATALGAVGRPLPAQHLNPMIDLHAAGKPIFGLYAPSNPRPRGPGAPAGAPAARPAADTPPAPVKSPAELARDAVAFRPSDFIFDGGMEHDFDRGYPGFLAFVQGVQAAGSVEPGATKRLRAPLVVKSAEIGRDTALARQRIGKQLNLGVSTIVFPSVEHPEEVRAGIAAMRFRSQGGTRSDEVGTAPTLWGVSPAEYRTRADVWPLNPKGELTAWAIVESHEGLRNVREIAAVQGISALFPGAGTLRGVFSTVDPVTKERKFDTVAWEAAIQQVLAACKEFKVPCGYPANDPQTVEERMKQGFSVFIAGWGDSGFRAVEHGRKQSGR